MFDDVGTQVKPMCPPANLERRPSVPAANRAPVVSDAPADAPMIANRWVGILHACLDRHEIYREDVAWPEHQEVLDLAA